MNRSERRRIEKLPEYKKFLSGYRAAISAVGDLRDKVWASAVYACEAGHEEVYYLCVGVEHPHKTSIPEYPAEWVPSPFVCGRCAICGGPMSHIDWQRDEERWPPTELAADVSFFRLPTETEARDLAARGYGGAYFVSRQAEPFHSSALEGVVLKLASGVPLPLDAVNEIERLLDVLRAEGWSGSIPADEAAKAMLHA